MSSSHTAAHIAEATVGAINELGRQGGQSLGLHPHGVMQVGATLAKGAAVVAPGAVGALSAGTATTIGTVSALATAAAPVAVPILAVGAVCYGIYRLLR